MHYQKPHCEWLCTIYKTAPALPWRLNTALQGRSRQCSKHCQTRCAPPWCRRSAWTEPAGRVHRTHEQKHTSMSQKGVTDTASTAKHAVHRPGVVVVHGQSRHVSIRAYVSTQTCTHVCNMRMFWREHAHMWAYVRIFWRKRAHMCAASSIHMCVLGCGRRLAYKCLRIVCSHTWKGHMLHLC